ncbi:DEAD/DEAH box helicase, partial [Paenibacillus sp. 28ISP30-2]|nr:DEAD/DEAH box helicase [Paenibacillus sp. 28ISP30-2]
QISHDTFLGRQNFDSLELITDQALLWETNECIILLRNELISYHKDWNPQIQKRLSHLHHISAKCGAHTISLISLILILINKSFPSRAISTIPPPSDCPIDVWKMHMERYLKEKIYLVWTPHKEAISKGLLQHKNNIVAIPTGTGKSLIAEHKIIASLQRGAVVIYLAPTHALCRQISERMYRIKNIQSIFSDEIKLIDDVDSMSDFNASSDFKLILVMTPEKCTTLLVKQPDLFAHVSLFVVDEFHNIKQGSRGALLDSLLA